MKNILFKSTLLLASLGFLSFVKNKYIYYKYYSEIHTMYYVSDFSKPEEAAYQIKIDEKYCDEKNIHKNVLLQGLLYHETKSECLAEKLREVN